MKEIVRIAKTVDESQLPSMHETRVLPRPVKHKTSDDLQEHKQSLDLIKSLKPVGISPYAEAMES